MGLKSRKLLHKHIQGLISAGLVEFPTRKRRGVRLVIQTPAPLEMVGMRISDGTGSLLKNKAMRVEPHQVKIQGVLVGSMRSYK